MNYKRMWESLKERLTVTESTGNMLQQAMSNVLLDNMLRIEEREKKIQKFEENKKAKNETGNI